MRPGYVVFPEVGLTDSATLVIEGMIVLILYEPVIVFVIRGSPLINQSTNE